MGGDNSQHRAGLEGHRRTAGQGSRAHSFCLKLLPRELKHTRGSAERQRCSKARGTGAGQSSLPISAQGGSSRPSTTAARDARITAKPNSLFATRLKYLSAEKKCPGSQKPALLYKQSNKQATEQQQDLQPDLKAHSALHTLVQDQIGDSGWSHGG